MFASCNINGIHIGKPQRQENLKWALQFLKHELQAYNILKHLIKQPPKLPHCRSDHKELKQINKDNVQLAGIINLKKNILKSRSKIFIRSV